LGKDNPNAHKYSKDAPSAKYKDGKRVNSDVSGKSGGHSHQRIQKADAAHHDVYVYDRNESVELDEISKATLRKVGGQMLRKGLSDDPKADKHMKYANLASAKLYPNQYKNSPLKAKVNATEEVESLDELSKKTLGSYVKKAAGDAVTKAYRAGDVRDKDSGKNYMKALGRQIGISTATSKLAKEEVELDEVSTATLQRYKSAASKAMDRASDSAIDKMLGSKDSQSVDISKEKKTMDKRSKGVSLASNKLAKEEFEQIDELSKKTLGSYVKKASRNLAGREYKRGAEKDTSTSNLQKSYKRDMGIAKAVDKLTKEEVENLDELKKSTLGSYVKKAAGSMAGKTAVAAAQASSSMGKSSPDIKRGIVNRMKGITRATDKLAKEEADLEEKLVGGQKKLDHNKNGKIDSHDFHLMRKKKMKEEVEGLDEISRDLARRYIRKIADKTNTGELSVKQVEKRRPGLNLAGKKAYPSIAGEPKVRATD
jgi:chemotaxis receptor (MCP) glutamine deamidase CheD